jgi:hypothetical protein
MKWRAKTHLVIIEGRAKVCDDCQGYLERLQHTLASGGVFSPNEEIEVE